MHENTDNADALAREMAELDEGERIRRWKRGMQAAQERQRALRAEKAPGRGKRSRSACRP